MPILQYRHRDGVLDLGWGHPHPDALPVAAWGEAYARALRRHGPDSLAYGNTSGPAPLVDWLGDRYGSEPFITAGASHALELVAGALIRPGDVVLVQSPTYHLALRTLRDHTRDLIPLPGVDSADGGGNDGGVDVAATGRLIEELADRGRRVALAYVVPVHANPTGATLTPADRAALAATMARHGSMLVEDDTYVELAYDGPPEPWDPGYGDAVRIGSFAKTVGPGLRLGWFTGPGPVRTLVERRGYLESGGGVNHHTALAMAEFGQSGDYDRHLRALRGRYRDQRDALVAAVREHLAGAEFADPAGGWFLWVRVPGVAVADLLPAAVTGGVSFLPGRWFTTGGEGPDRLRLSYSMLDPDRLVAAARRLAGAYEKIVSRG